MADARGTFVAGSDLLSAPERGDAHAVIIGIDHYQDDAIRNLRYACADARAVHDVLIDPELGRFKPDHVTLLLDEKATQREIRSAIGTHLRRRAGEQDTVFVFFAGHGAPEVDPQTASSDGLEKYLIPHDAEQNDLFASAISMKEVQTFFGRIASRRVVFFIDSCYSGMAGGRTFEDPRFQTRAGLTDEFLDLLAEGEGRLVVTACGVKEVSLETPEIGHGLFTHYLVEGLKGKADKDQDGRVTMDELYDYVYANVERHARELGGSMRPVRKGSVQGTVYLTQYETEAQKRARSLHGEAQARYDEDDLDAAFRLWEEVLQVVPEHEGAQQGLAEIEQQREEARRQQEEQERERQRTLERRQRKLLQLYREKELSTEEYNWGMNLLGKDPGTRTKIGKMITLLDGLIQGSVSDFVYLATVRLMRAEEEAVTPSGEEVLRSDIKVVLFWHEVGFTYEQASGLSKDLKAESIPTDLVRHRDPARPDAVFIGALVGIEDARYVLTRTPYEIRYLFPLDYPSVEGGDHTGRMIGLGYMSDHYEKDRGTLSEPVRVTPEDLAYLLESGLSNVAFQKRLRRITWGDREEPEASGQETVQEPAAEVVESDVPEAEVDEEPAPEALAEAPKPVAEPEAAAVEAEAREEEEAAAESAEDPVAEAQEGQAVAPPEEKTAPPAASVPARPAREKKPVAPRQAEPVPRMREPHAGTAGLERWIKEPKRLAMVAGGVVIVLVVVFVMQKGCGGSPGNDAESSQQETQGPTPAQPMLPVGPFASIPDQSWSMGTYEVTQGQWKAVMGTEPWKGEDYVREGDDYPAVYVRWDDAQAFIAKLNALDSSYHYRLPTAEEWEYACRAGTTTDYSFGDDEGQLGDYAWYGENAWNAGEQYAHQVGLKKPNTWGLYDMHGNVWEWTETPAGSLRVYRGGGFSDSAGFARSAFRSGGAPGDRNGNLGFRLLRTAL